MTIRTIFILFSPLFLLAQEMPLASGSARVLEGDIYNVSCFVSGQNENWTYEEKLEILEKAKEGNDWLKSKAREFGTEFSFQNGNIGLSEDVKLSTIERSTASGTERDDWVYLILKQIGYENPLDYYNWVIQNTTCSQLQFIIYVKGNGTGYALPFSENLNREKYFIEGVILYEKYWNGRKLASASIAHETLHLYGAWDFYKTHAQTTANEIRARKLFPNSIMLRTSFNINSLEIDELTAHLIGWRKEYKNWYSSFMPSDY
ncbi:MAG: hypothetical protein ACPG5P_04420 [Saprospiraceae bacterium]